jgi:hypothetical protein
LAWVNPEEQVKTHDIAMPTFTLFSLSNSVHILQKLDSDKVRQDSASYLGFVAIGWLDIVHDVDVDVIENDATCHASF